LAVIRILLVDDDEIVCSTLAALLKEYEFEVTMAVSVSEALKFISSETYDVLLSDLHMPGAGDGLTVVSAMRHANPKTITMLLSAFPEMDAAAQAILLQSDEILVKPMDIRALVAAIRHRLTSGSPDVRVVESVAAILERSIPKAIQNWFELVQTDEKVMAIPLSFEQRCSHLPQVFRDLIARLLSCRPIGTKEAQSPAAARHGVSRRKQGYTAAMLVEESRILQVTVFDTLQRNLASIDFSVVLIGVMTIADEIDSQLSQAMQAYTADSVSGSLPA
jgi:CheY-like chemotaxis protein